MNYYFVCHRELWFFAHGVQCETESDLVRLGKHIHETSFQREQKEIDIDGTIVLDWFDEKQGIVHEVKKSDKMETAHQWQLLYYLFYLKTKGLIVASAEHDSGIKGELNYPTLRTKKTIILTPEKEQELTQNILPDIERVIQELELPHGKEWKVCKSCSYCELCHS